MEGKIYAGFSGLVTRDTRHSELLETRNKNGLKQQASQSLSLESPKVILEILDVFPVP